MAKYGNPAHHTAASMLKHANQTNANRAGNHKTTIDGFTDATKTLEAILREMKQLNEGD